MELSAILTPAAEGGYVAFNPETRATTQGDEICFIHPDSASGIIVMAAWKRLRATKSK